MSWLDLNMANTAIRSVDAQKYRIQPNAKNENPHYCLGTKINRVIKGSRWFF